MKSCAISSAIDPKTKSNQGDVWHLSAVFYKHALCVDYSSIQVSELAWSMAELSIIPWWQLLIQYLTPHSYLQFIKANPTFMCMPVTFFFFFSFIYFRWKIVLQGWTCTSLLYITQNHLNSMHSSCVGCFFWRDQRKICHQYEICGLVHIVGRLFMVSLGFLMDHTGWGECLSSPDTSRSHSHCFCC